MKILSILVPSRNMKDRIEGFFSRVYNGKADEEDFEVVVVDSSTDGSEKLLEAYASRPSFTLRHFDKQVRCGTARNIAAKAASGKYVYCMDIDDRFCGDDTLGRVIELLKKEDKDVFFCPFVTPRNPNARLLPEETLECLAYGPVGCWTKIYKRELYVDFPDYMPEDVPAHFLLLDRCRTVGQFGFPVYWYDNTSPSAISRTFDYMKVVPHNLLQLAVTSEIEDRKLRQEYVSGCIRNLADMFDLRSRLKTECVRNAWADKFRAEYQQFMSGFFIH